MWQFFADNPWVAVFAVITVGSLLGLVRFGPVRLGAAGVLFVGLFVGALDEDIAAAVPAGVSALGLALYVYTVGLESGPAFFRELRGQLPVMAGAVVALAVTAAVVGFVGHSGFGIDGPFLAGGYAGIGTTTPGLAAAQDASEDPTQPAVGYAIGYPLAVVITIMFISAIAARRRWTARRDPDSGLPSTLVTRTVEAARDMRWADVPGVATHRVLASEYRPAGGATRVARQLDRLSPATWSSWSAARTTYGLRPTRSAPSPRAICWTTAARWTTAGSCSPTRNSPGTPSPSSGSARSTGLSSAACGAATSTCSPTTICCSSSTTGCGW